jgi:hypothetical protein
VLSGYLAPINQPKLLIRFGNVRALAWPIQKRRLAVSNSVQKICVKTVFPQELCPDVAGRGEICQAKIRRRR